MSLIDVLSELRSLKGMQQLIVNAVHYVNTTYDGVTGVEKYPPWEDDVETLTFSRPAYRTAEGHDHTMLVLDIDTTPDTRTRKLNTDVELRPHRLTAAMMAQEEIMLEDDQFFNYISGKGAYMVRRIEPAIPKTDFYPKVMSLVTKCKNTDKIHKANEYCEQWHEMNKELFRWTTVGKWKFKVAIDLNFITKEGFQVFRLPYTIYPKIQGHLFICTPVVSSGNKIDYDATILRSLPDNIKLEDFTIPVERLDISATRGIVIDTKAIKKVRDKRLHSQYVRLNVPSPQEGLTVVQQSIVDKMEEQLLGGPRVTPPCMKNAYVENMPNKHLSRVLYGRYFLQRGYSLDEIGTFIRFKVNDEEDNRPENLHQMDRNINSYIAPSEGNPRKLPRCSIMQRETSDFYSCRPQDALLCGRPYVMEDPRDTSRSRAEMRAVRERKVIEAKKGTRPRKGDFAEVIKKTKAILKYPEPTLVKKTTRAGLTTSLVIASKEAKKKLLVLEPTNRIAKKTFPEAVQIAKDNYRMDITGAVLSSNPTGCLKVKLKVEQAKFKKDNDPDWGEKGVAFMKLPLLLKPACAKANWECEFFYNTFDTDEVVIDSEVTSLTANDGLGDGKCARITVLRHLEDFEVIFATYAKMVATLSDSGPESIAALSELVNFDVVMLDEISILLDGQPKVIEIAGRKGDKFYPNSDKVRAELAKVVKYTKKSALMVSVVEQCLSTLENSIHDLDMAFIRGGVKTIVVGNPLSDAQRSGILALYATLQWVVENKNIDLSLLAAFLLTMTDDEWYLTAVTNMYSYTAINLITKPELTMLRNFIADMVQAGKKIVVTDAALPPMSMKALLHIDDWREVDLGDPSHTNEMSLIIPDTRKVNVSVLEDDDELIRCLEFADEIIKAHGEEDVIVVLPNSRKAFKFMKEEFSVRYPKVQITYYRSDLTVGVASERRTMLAYCKPLPPEDSYNWLATHWSRTQEGDITGIAEMFRQHSARQSFYQTVGRVKDPAAATPSVIYVYGMRYEDVMDTLGDFSPPVVINHREKAMASRIMTGTHWRRTGDLITPSIVSVLNLISKKGRFRVARLEKLMKSSEFEQLMNSLSIFGLEYDTKTKTVSSVEFADKGDTQ